MVDWLTWYIFHIISINHISHIWVLKRDSISEITFFKTNLETLHAALYSKPIKDVWCIDADVLLQPAEDGWMVMLKHSEDEWITFLWCGEKGWMVRLRHSIKERAEDGWLTFSVFVDFRTGQTHLDNFQKTDTYCLWTRRQVTTTILNQAL